MGISININGDRTIPFLILLAFLITFALTRLYTRLARTRGWGSAHAGDVHVHHMVVGIIFVIVAGFLGISFDPGSPYVELIAIFFGIGAGLTLDEFALWLHLKDVYWTDEGRSSVDAVIMATLLGGVVVLGMTPVGFDESAGADILAVSVTLAVVASVAAILKGKFFMGMIGLFIPVIAYVAAIRLARPNSAWARRRYARNARKMARAIARDTKREARKIRVRDFLGGAPTLKSPQP